MADIFFIRHGESQANVDQLVAGQTDSPLTKNGVEQAIAAIRLASSEGLRFDVIVSSPLMRAHDTASVIATELRYPESDIIIKAELKERGCGDFENGPVATYFEAPESISVLEHGVESLNSLYDRCKKVTDELKAQYHDKSILLVSHSGTGKMLRIVLEGRDAAELNKTITLPNATIFRLF